MYKKEYQKNKYICVDIGVCVCLLCYRLYKVRYVCRRRVSRERLVMRGLNYVFWLLLLHTEYGFFVIYEAKHTMLHTNSEHNASRPQRPFGCSRRNDPAIVRSIEVLYEETRLFYITKGSPRGEKRISTKPATSTTELVIKSILC